MGGKTRMFLAAVAAVTWTAALAPAGAQTIVDEWASVKAPNAVELKKVKVDPKTTAFLVLDLVKQTCNSERRPRCLGSLPKVEKFLAAAREHKMPVIYSLVNGATTADVASSVAPKADEPHVTAQANKFIKTDLDKMLKDRGIQTVIVVGTTAEGAVLFTGSEAAFLGYNVIVPVDGSTAGSQYAEQAVAWIFANGPGVAQKSTLTRFDMIEW
jgi:nicotinamidase-related amidase